VAVVRNGADLARYPDVGFRAGEAVVIGFVASCAPGTASATSSTRWAAPGMPAVARLADRRRRSARAGIEEHAPGWASPSACGSPRGRARAGARASGRMDICVQRRPPWAAPLKLPEYMAAPAPSWRPTRRTCAEVLTHGRDALLFAPDSPEALQQALVRLARDAGLRERLGREARRTVEREQLTWDGAAQRVEAQATACLKRPA
jgi:hypothetical protein